MKKSREEEAKQGLLGALEDLKTELVKDKFAGIVIICEKQENRMKVQMSRIGVNFEFFIDVYRNIKGQIYHRIEGLHLPEQGSPKNKKKENEESTSMFG